MTTPSMAKCPQCEIVFEQTDTAVLCPQCDKIAQIARLESALDRACDYLGDLEECPNMVYTLTREEKTSLGCNQRGQDCSENEDGEVAACWKKYFLEEK